MVDAETKLHNYDNNDYTDGLMQVREQPSKVKWYCNYSQDIWESKVGNIRVPTVFIYCYFYTCFARLLFIYLLGIFQDRG